MGNSEGFSTDGIPDQGWKIYVSSTCLVIGAGCFVIARWITRIKTHQLGVDDYAILASLGFSIILSVAIQLAVLHGYGEHKHDLTKPQLHKALFWFFIEQIQYKMVICLNKVSVILLAKRIFIARIFQIQCWIVLGVIICWTIASVGATVFQCVPVRGAWNSTIGAKCIDTSMFWMAYAVTNILTDAICIVLPIPEVLQLSLNTRQKTMLCGVFLLGGFVTLCSIMRIIAVIKDDKGKDTTWDFVPRNIWSLVETNIGIICACLPVLKTPILRGLSTLLGTTRNTRREHGSAYELNGGSAQQKHSKSGHKRISKDPWGDLREDGASDEVQIMDPAEREARSQHADLDFGFAKARPAAVKEIEPL